MKQRFSFQIDEFVVPAFRFCAMLVVYQILRLIFFLFNQSYFPNVTMGSYWDLMVGGFRFDVSALVYINLLYFVLHFLSFRAKQKVLCGRVIDGVFILFNSVGIAANCADLVYYRFILHRTTSGVLESLSNEQNMGSLWFHFVLDYWYCFVIFGLFVWLLFLIVKVSKPQPSPLRDHVPYVVVSLLAFGVVAGLSVAGIRGGFLHSTRPIAMSNAAAYTQSPEESAVVLNSPFCIIRTIGKHSFSSEKYFESDEALARVYSPVHNIADGALAVDTVAVGKVRNVVIFIMESFSREFWGCLNPKLEGGSYRGFTPFLDSLAQHSLVFSNAYANGRKSIDAMPSILASLPSLTMPYVVSQYGNNRINSIASLLGEEGYSSAFFHGAANGSMGFDGIAKLAGFERYYGRTEYDNDDDYDGIWGIWDEKFFQYYEREIGNMPRPFVTALFSLSSHDPFKVPAEYEGVFPKGKLPVEECIAYSDNALRRFFDEARKESWYDSTLFVITADHSSVPDHDEYNNNAQAFAVPILFFAPQDSALVGMDDHFAQQADIMPSVLKYLGYSKPFVSFGRDLMIGLTDSLRLSDNAIKNRFVINYNNDMYQLYNNDTIVYFDGKTVRGAYDLRRDPALLHNVADSCDMTHFEEFAKAYVQQYNLRMIGDSLTVK